MRLLLWLVIGAIFIGIVFVCARFAVLNAEPTSIDYLLGTTTEVQLWVLLVACFAAGALIALALTSYELAKKSLIARRYRRRVRTLEAELHELRNLPLVGSDASVAGLGEARTDGGGSAGQGA